MNSPVALTMGEVWKLEEAQHEGLCRGATLLANLTCSWKDMALQSVSMAASIGAETHGYIAESVSDDVQGRLGGKVSEVTHAAVQKFLDKIWVKVERKIARNENLAFLCRILKADLDVLLVWLRKLLINKNTLSQIVPFWNVATSAYDALMAAAEADRTMSAFETLKDMGGAIDSGFPRVAMDGFIKYAANEARRTAGKAVYSFGKSIVRLICQIVSAGATAVADIVFAVTEAVASWVFMMVSAYTFHKATKKCAQFIDSDEGMDIDQFRGIIKSCPFFAAVFFGGANYIGHFHLTSLLARRDYTISSSALSEAVSKVGEAQKIACGFVASSRFEIDFRNSSLREEFGWLLKMMRGYASDTPKSEFLTADATRWQRVKHKMKNFKHKHL